MFTLSDASKETKLILKWGAIIIIALIALFLLIKVTLFIKELIFPTPPPKPTVAFGKLQPAVFPLNSTDKPLNFVLNTVSGDLPNFPDQTKVYVIDPYKPDLLNLERFQAKVTSIGFTGRPIAITDKIFEWQNNPELPGIPRRFRGNIVSFDFTIDSNYASEASILKAVNLPNEQKSINLSKRALENMELLSDDIDTDNARIHLFAIKNGRLSPATSLSNSNIVEVDFFQKNVNKLPIYYENPISSNMNFLLGAGTTPGTEGQIVGARFIHQKISNRSSTYPIKTSLEAYEELLNGKAYIASYFGDETKIPIKNVFLAYFVGTQPQDFLLPIYIFQGDEGFYAYVSAVTDEWINK